MIGLTPAATPARPPRYRTVWISDLHLGSRGCRAADLSRFLKRIRCDRMYLVGDVIDGWRLKRGWYWPQEHNDVFRRILKHTRRGTEVVFLPGNHDEFARPFHGHEFGGVKVMPYAVHCAADGRKLLVIHGDQFDLVVQHHPFLSALGGVAYEWLIRLNRHYNTVRSCFGLPYYSMSRAVKSRVKQACTFISRFEETLVHEAKRRGLDGVVCGHIHQAEARDIDGVQYLNCGDWVESCTALVEHADGRIELIDGAAWLEQHDAKPPINAAGTPAGDPDDDPDDTDDHGDSGRRVEMIVASLGESSDTALDERLVLR